MSDEEIKGEAGENVVALTEEGRLKRRYDKVNADFEEWERNIFFSRMYYNNIVQIVN
jgi:hypothetical protein